MSEPDRNRRVRHLLRRTFIVPALALAMLAAGCGGGEEEDLTKEGFIADADAICAQYAADSTGLERSFNQSLRSSDLEAAAQDLEDKAGEVTEMLDQLEALTPPVADETTVGEIIALGRERVAAAQDAADAMAGGDAEAMIAAAQQGAILAGEFYVLADGFGFETCGSGGAAAPGGAGTGAAAGPTGTTGSASSTETTDPS